MIWRTRHWPGGVEACNCRRRQRPRVRNAPEEISDTQEISKTFMSAGDSVDMRVSELH
jgi:hypothetical protein